MKRLLTALMCLALLLVTTMPAFAYSRHRHHRRYARTAYSSSYNGQRRVYYTYGDRRTFWQKHRDKLTTAGGVLGGAAIGGLAGGGRGAGIGAIAGGAGSALYTYKLRKKHRYPQY